MRVVVMNYRFVALVATIVGVLSSALAWHATADDVSNEGGKSSTLAEVKQSAALESIYRKQQSQPHGEVVAEPNLEGFEKHIRPILSAACTDCHGEDIQEASLRVDALDPNLFTGEDVDWWLEVLAVLSNGEMPPPDASDLSDQDRTRVVEWLSTEAQSASMARRSEQGHTSFRRMTRYEYNYALQDLLGLPYEFAKDLPPESNSEDGFQNSSEMLHLSASQLETYRESSLKALQRATVRGDRPQQVQWSVSMQQASAKSWAEQEKKLKEARKQHKDNPKKLERVVADLERKFSTAPKRAYYKNLSTGRVAAVKWSYNGARFAWSPTTSPAEPPSTDLPPATEFVAILPAKREMIVELGEQVPDSGPLKVQVRASRLRGDEEKTPSLALYFGWQASNDSEANFKASERELLVDAPPGESRVYEWTVPIGELYPRNSVRKTAKMGETPSPSEYIKLRNSASSAGGVQIDYVTVTAPAYSAWPPESHRQIFIAQPTSDSDELAAARQILTSFMSRAWRRDVTLGEVDQKLALLETIRPTCDDFQQAIVEVLATVLASPKFLYLVHADSEQTPALSPHELASRLSFFLWSSTPDDKLLTLAANGQLTDADVLASQVERMLADPRARRFSKQFVRQWLGMQLLDYLDVDRKAYPHFDRDLKRAMQQEPVALFDEMLAGNNSVLDFLHCDYTMANERLAKHYKLPGVYGNEMRRVEFDSDPKRGGLLTQAGLLAMNSDGKDSHPLKRGVWLLERLLNDPPPPPPPAVPEIDLADPEIAKMTLKQRIEDHRNQPACLSCHAKIDPWGIAFENFDAAGGWRSEIRGQPVDAASELFNGQELDGIEGLKRFLLANRQDQFVRALVHKMTTYALGRPLAFGDRARIDQITANVRQDGDGLATMVQAIVASPMFREK